MKKLTLLLLLVISMTVLIGSSGLMAMDGGDILYTKPLMSVLFSHKVHAEDMGMGCDMCHPDLFEMAANTAENNDDFTMQGLYDGKYCGACHNGQMAFASNTQCARCHIGVKGYNKIKGIGEQKGGH